VLFRGNAEGVIRQKLIRKGYLKGIIGLPANLFYGTGIPACILVIDKAEAHARKGIFMIDASRGFLKDGNKNRLRSRDLHQIVEVFTKATDVPGYARLVPVGEIEQNDFNLNLPRYLDTAAPEDIHDIAGHLHGGIPAADLATLAPYWKVCPSLRDDLFTANRPGYLDLRLSDSGPATARASLKETIAAHPEFATFVAGLNAHFATWRERTAATLRTLQSGCHPKEIIHQHSEALLSHFATRSAATGSSTSTSNLNSSTGQPLLDHYAVYQHLMDYWAETMQDDAYLIAADGWKAEATRILETDKKGKTKDKGWTCDLVPKPLIVARYFAPEQAKLDRLTAELETTTAELTELEEEHSGEDGVFSDFEKITKPAVTVALRDLKLNKLSAVAEDQAIYGTEAEPELGVPDETTILRTWLNLTARAALLKKQLKDADEALDRHAYAKYPTLTEAEVKALVVDDKWLGTLATVVQGEVDRVAQTLTTRLRTLVDRYATPLPDVEAEVATLAAKVAVHLNKMEKANA
jgi:type I restriction enzyme M protein